MIFFPLEKHLWAFSTHHFHIYHFSFHIISNPMEHSIWTCCNSCAQSFSWYWAALAICHRRDCMEIGCWCCCCCCWSWLGRRRSMTHSCWCIYSFERFHAKIGLRMFCACVRITEVDVLDRIYWFEHFCVVNFVNFDIAKKKNWYTN